ncbi:MAG: quinolinate synthase NadA [Planctomycetota bacterium]
MDPIARIAEYKRQHNAVILAHNYQLPEIQDVADIRGDSLGLAIEAARAQADTIVFCGVLFMAETAKILNPGRTVLIPEPEAGCPLADMITAEQLRAFQAEHPGARTVCYVNSSAEVKALSDICCTSSNAVKVLREAFTPDEEILFVPDRNLAAWAAGQLPDRTIIPWKGFCYTHHRLLPEVVDRARAEHPGAEVIVHPECPPAVTARADHVLSTGGMASHVATSPQREFIIGTELGMLYRLRQDNPDKVFHHAFEAMVCPNMKKTNLASLVSALETGSHEVTLDPDLITRARHSIDAMLEHV